MKKTTVMLIVLVSVAFLSVHAQHALEKGKNLIETGKAGEAIFILKSVPSADAKFANARVLLAKAYLSVGKPDSAVGAAKDALDKNNKNPEAVIVLSQAYLNLNKKADAYTAMRKGLKAMKDNVFLLTYLGTMHLNQDSTDQAIVDFSRAKEVDPKHVPAYEGLGDVYVKLQGDAIAIMQYQEAVALDSSREELLYKLAKALMRERRYTEAANIYNHILKLEPDNPAVALELGNLYSAAKMYSHSARVLGPYVEKHLDDEGAWKTFNEALDNSNRYAIGFSVAEKILQIDPKLPKALRLAGKSAYHTRKYPEALGHYQNLGKIESHTAEDFKYLGRIHYELEKYPLAVQFLEKSISMDSTQSDLYMDLGSVYMRLKSFDKACTQFEREMLQDTTSVRATVNYALCTQQLGKWDLAKNALIKALKHRPNYIQGHYYLAKSYQGMDSVKAAKREYETVITLVDTSRSRYKNELADSYEFIAAFFLAEKNYQAALEPISRALQYKPKSIQLILWNAGTLNYLGKREEAKREYEKVLKLDPNNPDAKKGLKFLELF